VHFLLKFDAGNIFAFSGKLDNLGVCAMHTLVNCILGYRPVFEKRNMYLSDYTLHLASEGGGKLVGDIAVHGGQVLVKREFLRQIQGQVFSYIDICMNVKHFMLCLYQVNVPTHL
jgi:hypothetical protein